MYLNVKTKNVVVTASALSMYNNVYYKRPSILVKSKLEKKYKGIDERLVTLALESVDYNEDRAEQILNAVLLDDSNPKIATSTPDKHITKSAPIGSLPGFVLFCLFFVLKKSRRSS